MNKKSQTNWVNLLHIYQPPWQDSSIVQQIYQKSYLYLVETLEKYPQLHLTLNISGSLTEHLIREKQEIWIERIRKLVAKGQVELTGSAMYHPILPLIPLPEVKRQIELNEQINSHYFKSEWQAAQTKFGGRGFFLPELAYSAEVAKLIKEMGFSWLVMDSSGIDRKVKLNWENNYYDQTADLQLLIRNHKLWPLGTQFIRNHKGARLVTVSDGEIYQTEQKKAIIPVMDLAKVAATEKFNYYSVGEYFAAIAANDKVNVVPQPSNWEMTAKELALNSRYHVWANKDSKIHNELWKLIRAILDLHLEYKADENIDIVRSNLDKAISSCTWWWVDGRYHGYNPQEVTKGLSYMINVVRSFKTLPLGIRLHFEKIYSDLLYLIWEKHWQNQAKKQHGKRKI